MDVHIGVAEDMDSSAQSKLGLSSTSMAISVSI
jgi:hypothetical protein